LRFGLAVSEVELLLRNGQFPPGNFQVSGRNFLVYPDLAEDEELPISLEWKAQPPQWIVVDSFRGSGTCQSATARLLKLSNGLFAGGELREIYSSRLEGKSWYSRALF
jgi:hypothetical protein